MSSNVARRTALESLYSLKRHKAVLPLTNNFGPRVKNPKLNTSTNAKCLVKGNNYPRPSLAHAPRASFSSNVVPISHSPLLMQKDIVYSNGSNNGIRAHYDVASKAAVEDYDKENDFFFAISNDEVISSQKLSSSRSKNNSFKTNGQCATDAASDLVVVLDMDECIIHSQFLTIEREIDNDYRQQEEGRPPSQAFDYDEEPDSIIPSSCDSFRLCLPDGDQVHVNKRPKLDSFLKRVTSQYQTYIFTAAMKVYAEPLLDRLDPDGTMFAGRFYREHCTYEESLGVYVKDLNNIKLTNMNKNNDGEGDDNNKLQVSLFDDKRVVLVDNNPYSFLANPTNGILVSNFYDDPKDDTLQAVMELLDELDPVEDVRPVLDEKFGLDGALKEVMRTQGSWK